jgi:uncharacterized membrane protein
MMNAIMTILLMICLFCLIFFSISRPTLSNRNQTNVRSPRPFTTPPDRSLQSSSSSSSSSFSTAITKLTASNVGIYNEFGNDNAVSISNNRIVVGAWGYDNGRGAVYLFGDPNNRLLGRSYSQLAILTALDGQNGDGFGNSVAIDGDIVVVGATRVANYTGAVYVYRIVDSNSMITISQLAKLTASNGMGYDNFGSSVAINGNHILVGATGVNNNDSDSVVGAPGVNKNSPANAGSAYLFGNPSNDLNSPPEWTQLQTLQPDGLTGYDWFGGAVAMHENIAVVGTRDSVANAAYVFVPVINTDETADSSSSLSSSSTWTQMAKLTGSMGSYFGYSVTVAGNWIVVGAPGNDNTNEIGTNVTNAGSVFVFTIMLSSTWTQTTQLLAADGAEGDTFGRSVSISKDASTIVVGANLVDFNTTIIDSGAAYLFRTTNAATTTMSTTAMTEYTQLEKFVAADRDSYDGLGICVAIENNIAVVCASGDDSKKGSVYILDTGFSSPKTSTTSPSPMIAINVDPPTNSPSSNGLSTGAIIGVTAIVVVGVVVIVLGIAITFFNYRIKVQQQQQQPQQPLSPPIMPPPPTDDDMPIMANVVIVPPAQSSVQDRTVEADVLMDPAPASFDQTDAGEAPNVAQIELPRYKDQVRY